MAAESLSQIHIDLFGGEEESHEVRRRRGGFEQVHVQHLPEPLALLNRAPGFEPGRTPTNVEQVELRAEELEAIAKATGEAPVSFEVALDEAGDSGAVAVGAVWIDHQKTQRGRAEAGRTKVKQSFEHPHARAAGTDQRVHARLLANSRQGHRG